MPDLPERSWHDWETHLQEDDDVMVEDIELQSIFIKACKSNQVTCLDIIINRPTIKSRIRVAETDETGKSGLCWAVEKDHELIMEMLLNNFSGHCKRDLCFTLKKALKEKYIEIIEFLLQLSFNNLQDCLDLFDLLHGTIILCDEDSARKLLNNDKYHLPVNSDIFEAICYDNSEFIYSNSRSEEEILVSLVLSAASHNWTIAKRLLPELQQSHSLISSIIRVASEHNIWEIISTAVSYDIVTGDQRSYHERQELSKALFEAVRRNNDKIAFVLCYSLRVEPWLKVDEYGSSPLQEAHARGLAKFISIFHKSHPPLNLIAEEENIIKASRANNERRDKVFAVAKMHDPYSRNDGVKTLLSERSSLNTSLNANVRGQNGITLLHLAAASEHEYYPTWSDRDIKDLVDNQGGYINAVDCGGDTPLHYLCKGKERWSPEWRRLAKGMLDLGADPRIRNHKGKLPEECLEPQEKALRDLLEEKRIQLHELPQPDSNKKIHLLEKLNTAATSGNTREIKDLLKEGAPLESHGGFSGALHHAATMGERDATLLLLAAGASTSGLSSEGLTILQAVHRTPNLPALFPSLIRDEYCISLKKELDQISLEKKYESLRNGIQNLIRDIEEKGNKAKWTCVNGESDEWQNFVHAAHFGLTHTCLYMGWENIRIGRIQQDKEHPLIASVMQSQINTVWTLCRDLKLNPYFIPGLDESQLPKGLISSMRELEKETIEHYHLRSMEKNNYLANTLDFLKCPIKNSHHLCSFLRIVAELGLIHILHELRRIVEIDLSTIIEYSSKSQMIHIAALHGHRHMVEYLLFCGVPPDALANGGLTASHLAAVKGYKKCSRYLQMFEQSDFRSNNKMSAKDFETGLNQLISNVKLSLLSEEDEDTIFSDYDLTRTSRTHLEKKSIGMGIHSDSLLRKYALQNRVNFSLPENKKIKDAITNDVSRLVKLIGSIDSQYEGRLVEAGSVSENIRLFLPDEMDFNVELNNFSGLEGGNIKILSQKMCKEKYKFCLKGDSELEIYLQHEHNNEEMFSENNFIEYFYEAANSALETFVFESPNISIIYPGIQKTRVGIVLFLVWSDPLQCLLLPSIDVVPTIRANWPKDNQLNSLPKDLHAIVAGIPISIACYGSNRWRYCLSKIESMIIASLSEDKQAVILACKLLSGFLKTDWWYPDYYKDLYRVWNYIYLKVDSPVSYVIKTLFFRELSKHVNSEMWTSHYFYDRVLSIFMGMVKYDEKVENMQPSQVKSHLLPMYESQRFGDGAIDIIYFLRKLKDGKIKLDVDQVLSRK